MTPDEIMRSMPEQCALFNEDPFFYRIPGGESYFDLVQRLSPFVVELERQTKPVLVVSHLATLQVLYGYYMGCPAEKCHMLDIPQHTLIVLTPSQYGWEEEHVPMVVTGDSPSPSPRPGLSPSPSPSPVDWQLKNPPATRLRGASLSSAGLGLGECERERRVRGEEEGKEGRGV
jgi:broad specificity phosphatase PhoE